MDFSGWFDSVTMQLQITCTVSGSPLPTIRWYRIVVGQEVLVDDALPVYTVRKHAVYHSNSITLQRLSAALPNQRALQYIIVFKPYACV